MEASPIGYRQVLSHENGDYEDEDDLLDDQYKDHNGGAGLSALQAMIENNVFQMAIGTVIATNAAVIGFETDHPNFWMWPKLEDLFLAVFCLELSLRLWAYGFVLFFSLDNPDAQWNYFDFIIVTLGSIDRSCSALFGENKHAGQAKLVGMLMRSFRLMRILRIFKIFRVLKQFYLLVAGFVDAVSSVVWVTLLCALILYICAIMLTRILGRPEAEDPLASIKEQYFGSIAASMLTLFQLMAYPDMEKFEPLYTESVAMALFLVLFIIFGAFTIASILTGVISESMSEKNKMQQEERRAEQEKSRNIFVKRARKVFEAADPSGSGVIDRKTFDSVAGQVMLLCSTSYVGIRSKDLHAMFDLVDYQGSGCIEIEELLYGMVQLTTEVRPMSIMELRRVMVRGLHSTNRQIAGLDARTQVMDKRISEVLSALRAHGDLLAAATPAAPAAAPAAQAASAVPPCAPASASVSAQAASAPSAPGMPAAPAAPDSAGAGGPLGAAAVLGISAHAAPSNGTFPLLPPPPAPSVPACGLGATVHAPGAAADSLLEVNSPEQRCRP